MTQCQLVASSASISLAAEQCCSVTKTSSRTLWAARKIGGIVPLGEAPADRRRTEGPGGGRRWRLGDWGGIILLQVHLEYPDDFTKTRSATI